MASVDAKEIHLNVVVNPKIDRQVQGVVAFGDFELMVGDELGVVYPNTGDGLRSFYNDLILGRPFPLVFTTRSVDHVSTIVAVALFLYRDLAIHPSTFNVVESVALVAKHGYAGMAHIDQDLASFLQLLAARCGMPSTQERLASEVDWVRQYIFEGVLPALPPHPEPRILDHGTNGFVVAESERCSMETWVDLYRFGFLRGVLFGRDGGVLISRKSNFVQFDLSKACDILNEAEASVGGIAQWNLRDLWLSCEKTILPIRAVVEVLIRV